MPANDLNSSESSTSPPVVPAKILTKARPGEQSGGSSSSRSGAVSSASRPSDTRSGTQGESSGSTPAVRMVATLSGSHTEGGPTPKNLADNTMSSSSNAARGPRQPPPAASAGEYAESGVTGNKHQHQHHSSATVAVSNVSVNIQSVHNPQMPGGNPHVVQELGDHVHADDAPGTGFGSNMIRYLMPGPSTQTPRDREMERLKGELKKRNADLDNYQRELKRLRHDMKSHVTSINILQADRSKLTDTNNSMQYELINVKKQLEEIKTNEDMQTEKLKADLERRTTDLETSQRELKRLRHDMKSHVTSINILQADRSKLTDANNSMHYELIDVKKQMEEIQTLADSRGKELLDARISPSKADSITINDLKDKVVALNDEIFQAAAFLGETITHRRWHH
ncbi:hypothetical protein BJ165DRAFT_1114926 [Panaeolus papilionaceus]|nr:hypothetical protein BJ165DRAFT_1114926 [Panaeolus papilionaceus]